MPSKDVEGNLEVPVIGKSIFGKNSIVFVWGAIVEEGEEEEKCCTEIASWVCKV